MTFSPSRLVLFVLLASLLAWVAFDLVTDQRNDARRERDSAQSEAKGLREAARINGEMLAERDAIDLKNTTELTHVRTENQNLRLAVDDGTKRLRIRATCPASVPATTGAGGLADAGTAELTADARPDYFTLRDQIALSRQMILGLQQHIVRVCQR
ncbi:MULTISPECIES: lysis protein [unclassified Pseudomonas]|uniref:lysis protein n=1 Tax=unclassified Pseudomonas TaxID=196821 RepID=UPI000C87B37A|nr:MULTISPECIES: lysis protein [unclassified Pseudomonas]PMU10437.1 lysis protein [Pseudomonas sp. FW305-20]PMU21083.1 lysis protein [Pseudomonas sp. FW305-122]PMU34909.1 lysis protein [Pseudomonas sp. FW305-47B]PMX64028.1 lysis protein [Pseudomonas sp. FW305-33]PMX70856.1 lysis protein [Pseudomonas sp. FW305-60]